MDIQVDNDHNPPVLTMPNDLLEHARQVSKRLAVIAAELIVRGVDHDRSKFSPEEYTSFVNQTVKLKDMTYGSDEYRAELEKIRPAINHHYKCNRHHPQHFKDRIRGMNLIDIVEMFCDWHAAAIRQKDGNVRENLAISQKRFKLSDELTQIFFNTLDTLKEL